MGLLRSERGSIVAKTAWDPWQSEHVAAALMPRSCEIPWMLCVNVAFGDSWHFAHVDEIWTRFTVERGSEAGNTVSHCPFVEWQSRHVARAFPSAPIVA